jgi:membrane associated rhomboid family serine protease
MLKGIIAGGLLFVLFGLSPEVNVDVLAHAGGFMTGFLLGSAWVRIPARWQNPKVDVAAGLVLAGFIGLTCWRAWKN